MAETAEIVPVVTGWHFGPDDVLWYGDGRRMVDGEWLTVDGPLVMCRHGLHLSERPIDALYYARGIDHCRRSEGGIDILRDEDKVCCRARRPIWTIDSRAVVLRFARACALDQIHRWRGPVPAVVSRWLIYGGSAAAYAAYAARSKYLDHANARLESWLNRAHEGWIPPDVIAEDEILPEAQEAYRAAMKYPDGITPAKEANDGKRCFSPPTD